MRTFVFTYDRYDTLTTPLALGDIPHTVLCHSEEAKDKFLKAGRVKENSIIATGKEKGLANNRNAALDMMEEGEWAVWLVDDWVRCEQLEDYEEHSISGQVDVNQGNQKEWGKKFRKEVPMSEFILRCEESVHQCERFGGNLAGFTSIDNVLFKERKWKSNVLADGRAWVLRKTRLRFDENAQLVDDVPWCAMNIEAFGSVLVNQWVFPKCKRWSAGGYGAMSERMGQQIKEAQYLAKTYPKYVRIKNKKNSPAGSYAALRTLSNRTKVW